MCFDTPFKLRRAVRSHLCGTCKRRPPGSARWSSLVVRTCETDCTVFAMIPQVAAIAEAGGRSVRDNLQQVVLAGACMECFTCNEALPVDPVNCLCPLGLATEKVRRVIDVIATPACGAD